MCGPCHTPHSLSCLVISFSCSRLYVPSSFCFCFRVSGLPCVVPCPPPPPNQQAGGPKVKTCKVSVSFIFDWPDKHGKKILGPKVAPKDRKSENRISMPDIFQIRGSPLTIFHKICWALGFGLVLFCSSSILSHSVLHNSLWTLHSLPLASLFLLVWSLPQTTHSQFSLAPLYSLTQCVTQ